METAVTTDSSRCEHTLQFGDKVNSGLYKDRLHPYTEV